MALEETITAVGHEHVTAEHASTFEVTSDDWLTPAGDCILAVEADRTPADFSREFRDACRDPDARITATIAVNTPDDETVLEERIEGAGHPDIELTNDRSAVGRTSEYVDDRTILVNADRAACDLDRDLVDALANGADLQLTLTVES